MKIKPVCYTGTGRFWPSDLRIDNRFLAEEQFAVAFDVIDKLRIG